MSHGMQQQTCEPRQVAVFDYDGTCIDGQSGSLIAKWLLRNGYLTPRAVVGLAWWGFRYKFHLPYRQERSRELIFGVLRSRDADEIHRIMTRFHEEVLESEYRPRAVEEIARRKAEGCATVIVSATFEDIASEAAHHLGTDGFVATKMEKMPNNHYTGRVEGDVVAGKAKVNAVRSWADEHLGLGAWELAYAYGDHHSDIELLGAAREPMAVSPGPTLKKEAHRRGWPIANWKAD